MTDQTMAHVDPDTIRSMVEEANPAALLASIVALTGERDRIAEFLPHFDHIFIGRGAPIRAALPEAARAALDEWAIEVLSHPDRHRAPEHRDVDDRDFATLGEAMIGWPIDLATVPHLREEAGFVSFVPTVARTVQPPEGFKLAIIGAGMAGVAMAIAAKKAGIDFVVLEKQQRIGGVWEKNKYPGVGVDTPSKYYSFSFDPNPEWTNSYPEGDEFRVYMERIARKHGVYENFVFGVEVTGLVWDDEASTWTVGYRDDDETIEIVSQAVVTAAGYLSAPQIPDVPGLQDFRGAQFHSAEWDDSFDFVGKRVAVVGTGCTSVQIVAALSDTIDSLTLFQRQPHWVMPSAGSAKIPEPERWLLANVPTYVLWSRLLTFLSIGDVNYPAVRYDPEWAAEHEISISARNDVHLQLALGHLNASFADRPDLKEKLRPNFAPYGKRPVRDPGHYYETLKKESSTVVTTGLAQVAPEGIIDGEGTLHELDAIVFATGFTLEYLSTWTIVGRDGRKLTDVWGDSPQAYNGCLVPGFPNLFITSGPNATVGHGGGHNFMVEAVAHYVIESLQLLFETGSSSLEPTPEALERWQAEVRELMADTVWQKETRATTYYRNGKGDVILASPLTMEDYWKRLREPNLDDIVLS